MISSFIFIPNEVDAKDRNYDGISTDTPPRCRDRIILSDIELHGVRVWLCTNTQQATLGLY